MSTAGVLLAAGAGARYAGPHHKLLAQIKGRSVAGHALQSLLDASLDTSLDAVAVVSGAADIGAVLAEVDGDVEVIYNERWSSGIASSVRCAARWAQMGGHSAVVVGLADQPFVLPQAWRSVAASDGPIAVATYGSRRGNPVRLARQVWPLLPYDGDEGARAVIRRMPEIVVPVPCEGRPDDIDTMEDLRRWS